MSRQSRVQFTLVIVVVAVFIAGDYAVRMYLKTNVESHETVFENSGITGDSEPRRLSLPDKVAPIHATPINTDAYKHAAVNDTLPNATPEERNIWYEELNQFDADTIRDILQIRERLKDQFPLADSIDSKPAGRLDAMESKTKSAAKSAKHNSTRERE